jgi:hypothetical protein
MSVQSGDPHSFVLASVPKFTTMAKLLVFAGLLALACMSQAARLPSDALSMLDSLPQSMMGFQGAAKQQASSEDTSAAAQVVGNMMASAAHGDLEVRFGIERVANPACNCCVPSWPAAVACMYLKSHQHMPAYMI